MFALVGINVCTNNSNLTKANCAPVGHGCHLTVKNELLVDRATGPIVCICPCPSSQISRPRIDERTKEIVRKIKILKFITFLWIPPEVFLSLIPWSLGTQSGCLLNSANYIPLELPLGEEIFTIFMCYSKAKFLHCSSCRFCCACLLNMLCLWERNDRHLASEDILSANWD